MPYALTYGRIVSIGVPFVAICGAYGSIIRADGKPKLGMVGLLIGCVLNIILDPIFIFVCHWGVAGAAAATVIGQVANALLFVVYVFRGMNFVKIDGKVVKESFKVAGRFCNLGISTGAQPIYGYNYGAGKYDRVKNTYKDVYIASTVMLCVAFAIFQIFPMKIVSIFGSSDPMYNEFAVKCLKIFLLGLPISGLQLITGTFFQAMGYPIQSSLVSLSRQIIFMIPLLFLLTWLFGINGCLYLGSIADVLSVIFTAVLLKCYWGKIFRK
jgi:Na+-driven multidrug efflux pump